jgi:hypothetical protein
MKVLYQEPTSGSLIPGTVIGEKLVKGEFEVIHELAVLTLETHQIVQAPHHQFLDEVHPFPLNAGVGNERVYYQRNRGDEPISGRVRHSSYEYPNHQKTEFLSIVLDGFHEVVKADLNQITFLDPIRGSFSESELEKRSSDCPTFTSQFLDSSSQRVLERMIAANQFKVTRSFREYARTLPIAWIQTLAHLGPDAHWLDVGSGECIALEQFLSDHPITQEEISSIQQAMMDGSPLPEGVPLWERELDSIYLTIESQSLEQKPSATGITYCLRRQVPTFDGKMRVIQGSFFENIPPHQIPKADVISDFFGAFAYSPRLDEVIRNYLEILKPEGVAYVRFGDFLKPYKSKGSIGLEGTRIKTLDGREVGLVKWLEENKTLDVSRGIHEVSSVERNLWKRVFHVNLQIKRRAGVAPVIPRLKLVSTDQEAPPRRLFEEVK